jgi:hypothetical protein
MTLLVTVFVQEGIVMAADSRLTIDMPHAGNPDVRVPVGYVDTSQKLFLNDSGVGISVCGNAFVDGSPIAGRMDAFLASAGKELNAADMPQALLESFGKCGPVPFTTFHVAGYTEQQQRVYRVKVHENRVIENEGAAKLLPGAQWDGDADVVNRLVKSVAVIRDGDPRPLPDYPLPWEFFTLQDAIDFAIYLQRATIDSFRFQLRTKTVGGPIDIAVITPSGARWLQKKQLRGESDAR